MSRKRVLYVHSRRASFVAIDRDILAERYEVEDLYQPGRLPNPVKVVGGVLRADVVFGWFASWHTFFPVTLAWLLRKPSVMIVGGFDTANMPDIGYGYQQGGLRRWASRWIMRRATRLATNSEYSLSEIERNTPIPPSRVRVIHHGVPDPFGEEPGPKEREALTVSAIDRTTLVQKGQLPFVEAARLLPDVRFTFAGKWLDDSVDELRARAGDNVSFTGWLSDEDLHAGYRRAAVYVQASRHEGFGLAVAEAMLAGCVPVVMNVTAMPEVVGDAGVLIESQEPEEVAGGVTRALELGPDAARRARDRILIAFPMERRRDGILRGRGGCARCVSGSRRAHRRPGRGARRRGHRRGPVRLRDRRAHERRRRDTGAGRGGRLDAGHRAVDWPAVDRTHRDIGERPIGPRRSRRRGGAPGGARRGRSRPRGTDAPSRHEREARVAGARAHAAGRRWRIGRGSTGRSAGTRSESQ